ARFADAVPHDKPEIVHAFLVKQFQDYVAVHPDAVREPVTLPRLPGQSVAQNVRAVTREGWIAEQVAASEDLLWRKTCAECHTLSFSAANALAAARRLQPRRASHGHLRQLPRQRRVEPAHFRRESPERPRLPGMPRRSRFCRIGRLLRMPHLSRLVAGESVPGKIFAS